MGRRCGWLTKQHSTIWPCRICSIRSGQVWKCITSEIDCFDFVLKTSQSEKEKKKKTLKTSLYVQFGYWFCADGRAALWKKNFLMAAAITLVCLYKLWWVSVDDDAGVDVCRDGLGLNWRGLGRGWGWWRTGVMSTNRRHWGLCVCVNGNKRVVGAPSCKASWLGTHADEKKARQLKIEIRS